MTEKTTHFRHGSTALYLISSGRGPCQDLHKIGIAKDMQTRLLQLQTSNPFDLIIWHWVDFPDRRTAAMAERRVHQILDEYRQRGEWFQCFGTTALAAVLTSVNGMAHILGLKSPSEIDDFVGIRREDLLEPECNVEAA